MATIAGTKDTYAGRAAAWRYTKRYAWLLGMVIPALPIVSAVLTKNAALRLLWWSGPIFIFGIVPLLDTLIGKTVKIRRKASPPRWSRTAITGGAFTSFCRFNSPHLSGPVLSGAGGLCGLWTRSGWR